MGLDEGTKYDEDKTRLELLSPDFLFGTAEILTLGAKKYEDDNWMLGIKYKRVFGALLRHLWAWWRGEDNDPEWDKSHLYHAACCLMFLCHYESNKSRYQDFDNRPT